jgi:hypothetical protein
LAFASDAWAIGDEPGAEPKPPSFEMTQDGRTGRKAPGLTTPPRVQFQTRPYVPGVVRVTTPPKHQTPGRRLRSRPSRHAEHNTARFQTHYRRGRQAASFVSAQSDHHVSILSRQTFRAFSPEPKGGTDYGHPQGCPLKGYPWKGGYCGGIDYGCQSGPPRAECEHGAKVGKPHRVG